ncbi:unnamed protein product [Macrosiphum euphorbiae]|uniref:Uncharacterized protein n=1 Tax=Macrosiphum euphorbiae TaxID=13131 RepID=A0AAV0WCZ2_9HEMI|nr:unnamed protein product [Macrosiphum euphorbiae]
MRKNNYFCQSTITSSVETVTASLGFAPGDAVNVLIRGRYLAGIVEDVAEDLITYFHPSRKARESFSISQQYVKSSNHKL